MARQMISVVEIADVICEDIGDVTKRYRRSILRHLLGCYRNLNTFVTNDTEIYTECFPISSVIEMPQNFMFETKVGLKYGDRVVLLEKNYENTGSSILEVSGQSDFNRYLGDFMYCSELRPDVPKTPFYNYRGELVLYGYGDGIRCKGTYTVDRSKGRIIIGSEIPKGCEVVVEFASDGPANGLKMVPIEFYDCLYHYGLWKIFFQRSDPRYRQSEVDYDTAYYQLELLYKFVPIDYVVKLLNREMHTIDDRL